MDSSKHSSSNENLDLFPYISVSREVTLSNKYFANKLSGKHFNLTSCGVNWDQRSKIRIFSVISTSGGAFRKISKFQCRVI